MVVLSWPAPPRAPSRVLVPGATVATVADGRSVPARSCRRAPGRTDVRGPTGRARPSSSWSTSQRPGGRHAHGPSLGLAEWTATRRSHRRRHGAARRDAAAVDRDPRALRSYGRWMCGGSASTGQGYSGRRGSCCATRSAAFGDDCRRHGLARSRRGHGQRRPRRRPRARGGRLLRVRVRPAGRRARAAGRVRHAARRRPRRCRGCAPARASRATPRASASRSRSPPTPAPTRASRASTASTRSGSSRCSPCRSSTASERLAGAMNVRTAAAAGVARRRGRAARDDRVAGRAGDRERAPLRPLAAGA